MIDIGPLITRTSNIMAPYLSGIAHYLDQQACRCHNPEDKLIQKPREAYVRNLLAVAILSHLQRDEFLRCEKRVIILPECLKNYDDTTCCKGELPGGVSECTMCNADCLVFHSMDQFTDDRTAMYLEPDDLLAFLTEYKKRHGRVGVVGVACVLTLLSGFARTIALKLPTQGVFLNYSSCAYHWASPGFNTNYSFERMAQVLGKSAFTQPTFRHVKAPTYCLEDDVNTATDFYDKLDTLCVEFEEYYLPKIKRKVLAGTGRSDTPDFPQQPVGDPDLFELSDVVLKAIVPDLITRDEA